MTTEQLKSIAALPRVIETGHLKGQDDSNPYYSFLYNLAKTMSPKLIVELGTDSAGSTTYLAEGAANAKVISIDVADSQTIQETIKPYKNVTFLKRNTNDLALIDELKKYGPIDILFIDTEHSYNQAKGEYINYSPLVRPGGVIVYDDITLHEGMEQFWDEIPKPKTELNNLHWTGFGASIK